MKQLNSSMKCLSPIISDSESDSDSRLQNFVNSEGDVESYDCPKGGAVSIEKSHALSLHSPAMKGTLIHATLFMTIKAVNALNIMD